MGARAGEADRVEASRVERGSARRQAVDVCPPGGDRIRLVEPRRRHDGVPEALDVRLAEDRFGPAGVRVADDRPRDEPVVRHREHALRHLTRARACDPRGIEIGEQLGLRISRDVDARAVGRGQLVDQAECPRRRPVERLLVGELQACAPDVGVRVRDIDVARTDLVRLACDLACELKVVGVRGYTHELAGLDVHAHLDREACVGA